MKILFEAVGSVVSGYLIKAAHEAGLLCVGSDIDEFNHGKFLCDEFVKFPKSSDLKLWDFVEKVIDYYSVDIVLPSFDEMLLGWSQRKGHFKARGVYVIISDPDVVNIFLDKYKTYQFMEKIGIKTPRTSLEPIYPFVKPRFGRGSRGAKLLKKEEIYNIHFEEEMIFQEFIKGTEYTVDCFFNKDGKPIYIIPRKRIEVINGKSVKGEVIKNELIENTVKRIAEHVKFVGPVNFQFIEKDKEVYLIEVNPRIAGGMALGFASTENWIKLIVDHFIKGKEISPKPVKYGLRMVRYFEEIFF